MINFKRIGQEGEAVSRFQSNVEQAFKQVNDSIKRDSILVQGNSTAYSTGGFVNGILPLTRVPRGNYLVTVGAFYSYHPNDDAGYMAPKLNGEGIPFGSDQWRIGSGDDAGGSFDSYIFGPSSTRLVTFPKEFNSFDLTIFIETGGIIRHPEYILHRLENYTIISKEWN